MPSPQVGIFAPPGAHQHHAELRLKTGVVARDLRSALTQATRSSQISLVVGFSRQMWAELAGFAPPVNDFVPISGAGGWRAPSTQADLWVWFQADTRDAAHDAMRGFLSLMSAHCDVALDVTVFTRAGNRDLTGFIDGTANPKEDARFDAALIPRDQLGSGGSVALTQTWEHDLKRFEALPVAVQEAVIGRTKVDDIELEGDDMPPDSHVSRTDVKLDGQALKIFRRSAPFATATGGGLHFVAFACHQDRLSIQLRRMFGAWHDGLHDRLIEYSRPVSGSYWFVPSVEDLAKVTHG